MASVEDSTSLMRKDSMSSRAPVQEKKASGPNMNICTIVAPLLVLAPLIVVAVVILQMYMPLHASCTVVYEFNGTCLSVNAALVQQIHEWNGTTCGTATYVHQKCRYALDNASAERLTANHTTPVKKYVDDISMRFSQKSGGFCEVNAYSKSQLWYAFLDSGTNYCNIHNLVEGSGLESNLTSKVTSNQVCTQYSSANCNRFWTLVRKLSYKCSFRKTHALESRKTLLFCLRLSSSVYGRLLRFIMVWNTSTGLFVCLKIVLDSIASYNCEGA